MTSTKTTLNEITLSRIQDPVAMGLDNLKVPKTTCGFYVNHLVKEIPTPAVRDIVGSVFEDLLRLLECLSLSERHLRQVDAAPETFALFQIIHDEARALVKFIHDEALTCQEMTEEIAETLDVIPSAINYDRHRYLENNHLVADS